jgi:Domain of unknown function (DUF4252)
MRNSVYLVALIIFVSSCSRNPVNNIFDDAKKHDKSLVVSLPGWMIRGGIKQATKNEDIDEAIEDISKIEGALRGARVLVASDLPPTLLQNLNNQSRTLDQKGYSSYISVKNKGLNFNLYGFEKKDKLKDLFFYGSTKENEIILVRLETDISTKDFERIAKKVQTTTNLK